MMSRSSKKTNISRCVEEIYIKWHGKENLALLFVISERESQSIFERARRGTDNGNALRVERGSRDVQISWQGHRPHTKQMGNEFWNRTLEMLHDEQRNQELTSVSKSIFNIRSASSMTKYFRALKLKPFVFSKWSISRPGVAAKTGWWQRATFRNQGKRKLPSPSSSPNFRN